MKLSVFWQGETEQVLVIQHLECWTASYCKFCAVTYRELYNFRVVKKPHRVICINLLWMPHLEKKNGVEVVGEKILISWKPNLCKSTWATQTPVKDTETGKSHWVFNIEVRGQAETELSGYTEVSESLTTPHSSCVTLIISFKWKRAFLTSLTEENSFCMACLPQGWFVVQATPHSRWYLNLEGKSWLCYPCWK